MKEKLIVVVRFGSINQEDKANIGQRSEFSNIVQVEIPPISPILRTLFFLGYLILGIVAVKKIRKPWF